MKIENNKPLKEFTTFKIGGSARYYTSISHYDDLKKAVNFSKDKKIKFFILGNGSNIIFDSKGFDGLIIHIKLNFFKLYKKNLVAGAGVNFPYLGHFTAKNSMSGLEFAKGVPASLGGAVFMNASSFGQNVSDCLISVQCLNDKSEIVNLKKDECEFEYRKSIFQKKNLIILSARFVLNDDINALKTQKEMIEKKIANQPVNEKNAGCIFKNPKDSSAGKLIASCNLKDYKIGGAKISSKHANFIINENNATSDDVLNLIEHIKKTVLEKTKISLFEEVKYIPY